MEDYNNQQTYNNRNYSNYGYDQNQDYGYDPNGYGDEGPNKKVKGLKIMIIIMAVILAALSAIYFMQVKQMRDPAVDRSEKRLRYIEELERYAFGSVRQCTVQSRLADRDLTEGASVELCQDPSVREGEKHDASDHGGVYPSDRLAEYDQ